MLDGNVLLRQKRDEVPKGTLSCPDRIMEFFYQLRHYEGSHLLLSVCGWKLIQQTLFKTKAKNWPFALKMLTLLAQVGTTNAAGVVLVASSREKHPSRYASTIEPAATGFR